ncbi:hypothetical protein SKAU_G00296690 [Synaphobranchus kaupii]|uniref:Uncharacterized protein n=1 Tax=Synaphobranchus kaupii TaxID=118154 RepID=A0A9Q1IMW5_SYNKA|nr:hypothetical protein SKAU_G00296690 [Synaphobranchus kaupii]
MTKEDQSGERTGGVQTRRRPMIRPVTLVSHLGRISSPPSSPDPTLADCSAWNRAHSLRPGTGSGCTLTPERTRRQTHEYTQIQTRVVKIKAVPSLWGRAGDRLPDCPHLPPALCSLLQPSVCSRHGSGRDVRDDDAEALKYARVADRRFFCEEELALFLGSSPPPPSAAATKPAPARRARR